MVVPFSKKFALYLLASLSFTLSGYGTAILAFRNDQLFISLLLLGHLNLFLSSYLADFVRSLSKFLRTLLLLGILVLVMIEGSLVASFGFVSLVSGSAGVVDNVDVGVYGGFPNPISSIDWGTMQPGSSKNVTIIVSNESNTSIVLRMSTEDWSPESAKNYITLSWDYNGKAISPKQAVQITLILHVSEHTKGISDFTFVIVIIGEQAS